MKKTKTRAKPVERKISETEYECRDLIYELRYALFEASKVIKLQNSGNCLDSTLEALEKYERWLNTI